MFLFDYAAGCMHIKDGVITEVVRLGECVWIKIEWVGVHESIEQLTDGTT